MPELYYVEKGAVCWSNPKSAHVTIIHEEKGPSNYAFHRKKIKYVASKGFPGCFIEMEEEIVCTNFNSNLKWGKNGFEKQSCWIILPRAHPSAAGTTEQAALCHIHKNNRYWDS